MKLKDLAIGMTFRFAVNGTKTDIICVKTGCRSYRYKYHQNEWVHVSLMPKYMHYLGLTVVPLDVCEDVVL